MNPISVILIVSLIIIILAAISLTFEAHEIKKVKRERQRLLQEIAFSQIKRASTGTSVGNKKFNVSVKRRVKNSGPTLCDSSITFDIDKARKFSAPDGFFEVRKREIR